MLSKLRSNLTGARLLAPLFRDRSFFAEAAKEEFETAKRASDLVGMILRLAFCYFSAALFQDARNKIEELPGIWAMIDRYSFAMCWIASISMAIYLSAHMTVMVNMYLLRDMPAFKSIAWRLFVFISSTAMVVAFARGLYYISSLLAKSMAIK